MTPDREDYLVQLACQAVDRVRQDDPVRNRAWLEGLDHEDRIGLLITLAAMVDPSQPLSVALGWVRTLRQGAA